MKPPTKKRKQSIEAIAPLIANWPSPDSRSSVVERLLSAFKNKNLHPVLLLDGAEKADISLQALTLIASLFCQTNTACGTCDECRRLKFGEQHDLLYIDGKERLIKIEDAEELQNHLQYTPSPGSAQVRLVWIDCIENLHWMAANRLLKIFEEPPPSALIILTTNALDRIMPTIRSRAMHLKIKEKHSKPTIDENLQSQELVSDILQTPNLTTAVNLLIQNLRSSQLTSLNDTLVESFEIALNRYYKKLATQATQPASAAFAKIHKRRKTLKVLHRMMRRQKTNINLQLALEQLSGH